MVPSSAQVTMPTTAPRLPLRGAAPHPLLTVRTNTCGAVVEAGHYGRNENLTILACTAANTQVSVRMRFWATLSLGLSIHSGISSWHQA